MFLLNIIIIMINGVILWYDD